MPTKLGYLIGDTADGLLVLMGDFKNPVGALKNNPEVENILNNKLRPMYRNVQREANYLQDNDIDAKGENLEKIIRDVRSALQELLEVEAVTKARDARTEINNIITRINRDLD